jgi:hypothetical protein
MHSQLSQPQSPTSLPNGSAATLAKGSRKIAAVSEPAPVNRRAAAAGLGFPRTVMEPKAGLVWIVTLPAAAV